MMKRQLHRMRQLAQTGTLGRTPETAEFLGEDLLQVEQRLEPAKRAAHNVHKRLQACLQGQSGADMDKRVKKLPLMALSSTMAESFKELDPDSSMGKALEMSCVIQNQLACIVAEFEMTLERDVLQPLNRLSEEELPAILKHKKSLQKLVSDWNTLKSRLSQAAKNSGGAQGLGGVSGSYSHISTGNKMEMLKEEEEELKRKVEQCKDEYLADLYHFATKEDTYANYFIQILEIQADYHRKSLNSLDTALAELRENHRQTDPSPSMTAAPFSRVYGVSLGTHLQELGRDIALPIEACVMMLLSEGMKEEGLFRLAPGASVLKKLKQTMASDPSSLEEFCSDHHAVAGALKSYLRELPEPLMTFALYDNWMRAASRSGPTELLYPQLPIYKALSKNHDSLPWTGPVWSLSPAPPLSRYLMKFLARLAELQEVNKMSPSNIAIVLGPNLLWPPEKEGFSSLTALDKVSSRPASEEIPHTAGLPPAPPPGATPATTPGATLATTPAVQLPASATPKESRMESEAPPRPASPKVIRNTPEAAAPAEDVTRKVKRPAPARPTALPPQASSTRSSPPAPPPPPSSGSPGTPRALPRRVVGNTLRAPTVPPPLPPVPPQPARRQNRLPSASLGQGGLSIPGQGDLGVATEEGGGPEVVGQVPSPPAVPPQPRPRSLASETD
ncbi:SH3 domain-binding protein 1 [Echinops telfairi]|uniref:SH3 domain-binding protein 1 n=1 Tax=Echinops telfairi TaxID=9371 RepID=A0AC55D4T9_ECHTE|nr:SH3 domain-binding protein 1 [Echinops telfairi]